LDVGATCAIHLLGGFAVEVDGQPVPAGSWKHRRSAELIKLLALAPGHRLHREQVMDTLWSGLSPEAAGANLRKATHHLRRALGTPDPVVIEGGFVALCPDWPVTTDVEAFETAAKNALGAGPSACADAAGLYRGELLPYDRYADWAFEPRERLRMRYVQLLKVAGQWDVVLDADPADEEAHRALMRRHIDEGNRQAAIRQFSRLREALRSDLGIGPDRSSVELYGKALALEGRTPPTSAEQVEGLLAWGLVHWNRMELDDARKCAEQARALAIEGGLGRALGEATTLLGMVAHAQGCWRELFRSEFEQTLANRPDMASFIFDAQLCLAELSLYGPDSHTQIEPFARDLLESAIRAGSTRGQGLAWLMIGEAALFAGKLNEASTALSRAAKLHRSSQATSALALALIRSAETEIARGRRWQANRLLDRASEVALSAPLIAHLLVRVYAARLLAAKAGDRAIAALHEAERNLTHATACQPCSIGYHVNAALAAARSGDLAEAHQHLDTAERIAGMWPGGPWQAAVWEARGAIRVAEGDRAQGTALLSEAAILFANAGRPLDAARCRAGAA
jgi:DNA-binding SARP family transcriptional activator